MMVHIIQLEEIDYSTGLSSSENNLHRVREKSVGIRKQTEDFKCMQMSSFREERAWCYACVLLVSGMFPFHTHAYTFGEMQILECEQLVRFAIARVKATWTPEQVRSAVDIATLIKGVSQLWLLTSRMYRLRLFVPACGTVYI